MYCSLEPRFTRHQGFPSPQNSPSTLDSFSTSKQGSVLKCNILLAKTSAGQECSKGQVQGETCDSAQEAGAHSSGFRSQEHREQGREVSYKENLASLKVVANRGVRNTCNKQLDSTCSAPLLLKRF